MDKRHNIILNYLNPKKQAILEELGVDVFQGHKKLDVDCKSVFINAVLKSSESNNEELQLKQKDLAWYFNISEQSLYGYLERHSIKYREDKNYRSLSDYWIDKFCYSDSIENKEYYRKQLIEIAKINSERECKKIINSLIEIGYIIQTDEKITEQEFNTAQID